MAGLTLDQQVAIENHCGECGNDMCVIPARDPETWFQQGRHDNHLIRAYCTSCRAKGIWETEVGFTTLRLRVVG